MQNHFSQNLSHQFRIQPLSFWKQMYETCKIQQSIYLSPAFETVSPVVVFVNHLEHTDEKNTNLGRFC